MDPTVDTAGVLAVLTHGALELDGRLTDASNVTLRGRATLDGVSVTCVYKPVAGERPLWDFPDGTLAGREVAAFLLADAVGWSMVPPTVLRDGPLGPGMCQAWQENTGEPLIDLVPEEELPPDWHPVLAARDEQGRGYLLAHADDERLARLAVLDVVLNNADRKGGHVLRTADDRVYGVDHGVCFHVDPKLRTVLWGFAGRPLPDGSVEMLQRLATELAGRLGERLAEHLSREEVAATAVRAEALAKDSRFPLPSPDRPLIPWPPW